MKPRLYPYLDLLLLFAVLACGTYAYLHPATVRRWLDAVTLSTGPDAQSGSNRDARLNAPLPVVEQKPVAAAPVGSTKSWGTRIADGHAFQKHGREMGFTTRGEMAAHIDRVIAGASASRHLSRGRQAYWDDGSGTVVICDPTTSDGGTAFKPNRGRRYFEDLR